MTFGAEALKWDSDLFYFRTGIAIRLRQEMAGNGDTQKTTFHR